MLSQLLKNKELRSGDWVNRSFLVGQESMDQIDKRNRFFTTASFKYVDTSLGGNVCINPPPQFTDNADLVVPGIFDRQRAQGSAVNKVTGRSGGLGRYYSEAIDDNSRIISMRFGVPQFNSMTTFFTGFYNSSSGTLARTGRAPSAFFRIGQAAGFIVPLLYFPFFLVNLVGNAIEWLKGVPSSKYYYLKPTMPLYWNAVTAIVNTISVNKNIVPRFLDSDTRNRLGDRYAFSEADIQRFHDLLPDVAMERGGINVYAMATRGQRLARKMYKRMENEYKKKNYNEAANDLNALYTGAVELDREKASDPNYQAYLEKWWSSKTSAPGTPSPELDAQGNAVEGSSSAEAPETINRETDAADEGFKSFLEAELDDGSSFVSFRVDADGSANESFRNSVREPAIASKLNGMAGDGRSTSFSFAGGNLGGGVVGDMIGGVLGAVKDTLAGVADGLQMSGLAALTGSAFVDIPKHWENSTASLPTMNYTLSLVSPYGNKMSQLTNLYVPLAMLLAGVLPLSTGKQSYTSPFILELYDRGRAQTRLGIIESMSITRGTTNLAFNNEGEPMGIDVSFSVLDLSSVMHMPIVQGFSLSSPLGNMFDDDNTFTDYMATLGSLTLNEQIYTSEKFKLAVTRLGRSASTWFSKAHAANYIGDLAPMRLVSIFYGGIVNR